MTVIRATLAPRRHSKNYIHRVVPGEAIYTFFEHCIQAAQETQAMRVWGQRQWFAAAAHQPTGIYNYRINLGRSWLKKVDDLATMNRLFARVP